MENGFTQQNSKGLFTFYREQAEQTKKTKNLLRSSITVKERQTKKHYVSLSTYYNKKSKKELQSVGEVEHKRKMKTYRYHQEQTESYKKPLSTERNIFQPKLVEKSKRKNGYFLQLLGVRNKINRSEIQTFLKKQVRGKDSGRVGIGELSARQLPASEIRQLFLPKKEHFAKLHSIMKSPLKLNEITAHSIEQPQQSSKNQHMRSATDNGSGIESQSSADHHKNSKRNKVSSMILGEILQSRRNKMQKGIFWQQTKLKRPTPALGYHQTSIHSKNQTILTKFQDSIFHSIQEQKSQPRTSPP